MDNQHRKISGYRKLSQEEIDLMNEVKAKGEEVLLLIKKIRDIQVKEFDALCMADRGTASDEKRKEHLAKFDALSIASHWRDEGAMTIQKGFMALVRSIAAHHFLLMRNGNQNHSSGAPDDPAFDICCG